MDFGRLDKWQKFELLCNIVLSLEIPDYHSVEGSGGDEGIDGYTGSISNPTAIFQFKYFPNKLGGGKKSTRRKQIEKSLEDAAILKPKIWHLVLPATLNTTEWEWWKSLKSKYPEMEYAIWDQAYLTAKVLQHKEFLMTEFPELFLTLELANQVGENVFQKFRDDLTSLSLAESNIQLLTLDTIPEGSKGCWKSGHFRIGDIKNDYDSRRTITDKILDSIEENTGVLISGRSHIGKTTLLQRVCIEEIKKGYLILSVNIPIPNSVLLTNLLQRMLGRDDKKLLVLVDNADKKGVEEVLRCYNELKDRVQIRFVFVSRNIRLTSVVEVLSHDDQMEVISALATMEKIEVRFTEQDGIGFVKKVESLYGLNLEELQVTALANHFYEVSKGDPLIYVCMIISLVKNKIDPNKIELAPTDAFKHLEFDFNEKITSLNYKQELWNSAIYCIFLGSIGLKLSSDLLKKLGVYTNDLVKLSAIGILFDDSGEYNLRHERWGAEFLLYLYTNIFGEDFDSLDHKYNLLSKVKTLFMNLDVYEIIVLINRLESMLSEEKFTKFVRALVSKLEMPRHLNNKDAADLLCYGYGNFYQTAKEHTLALGFYDEAIKLNPNHWSAWNNMGNVFDSVEKYPEAKDSYLKSITIHSENPQAYYNIAKILNREGKQHEALLYIENAIYCDPQYTWAYHEKGNILVDMNKPKEAMIFYNRAIEFDPSNAAGWLNIGNTMLSLKNYDHVMFFLDRAERISPMAEVKYAKGVLAKDTSKLGEAAELFSKALKLQPNNLDYLRQSGIVQLMLNKVAPAMEYFDKVLEINKDDKIALGNSGICLLRLRRINEAILNIAKFHILISTEEDKLEFKNLIKILTASMLKFTTRIPELSVTRYLDHDLLLLYLVTFTDMKTVCTVSKILDIDM